MMPDNEPKFLLWAHDPCPEGGWHIRGEFPTQEAAIEAANNLHKQELAQINEGLYGCYDKCIVTPASVLELNVPEEVLEAAEKKREEELRQWREERVREKANQESPGAPKEEGG